MAKKKIPPMRQVKVELDGLIYRVIPSGGARFTVYLVGKGGQLWRISEGSLWTAVVAKAMQAVRQQMEKTRVINEVFGGKEEGDANS